VEGDELISPLFPGGVSPTEDLRPPEDHVVPVLARRITGLGHAMKLSRRRRS
jgi:hypothetical protein